MKADNLVNEHRITNNDKMSTALYIRLSREDGDKQESLSVVNQKLLLTEFVNKRDDLKIYDIYVDDGYTGTNFERPAFKSMIQDIENKKIQCVVVKDLSRLGRNMPKVTEYISDYFPSKKVRFIAITDNIDREYDDIDTCEDMAIDMKNMCNGYYPKDISQKVRSTLKTKQREGQFIGAFTSYGYRKSEHNKNQLIIDEVAATIVKRIFDMYISGLGQITIAKILNEEGIPCPSEYKRQNGLKYRNSKRLTHTSYWTYSTIRKILTNEIYIGNMVQNKSFRQICKKRAISLPREKWIIVKNTHEPIIDKDVWNKVQDLLKRNTKSPSLNENIHIFAGFLKCGDCGRAMVKITRKGKNTFNCGSYNRYGRSFCTIHSITEAELHDIVLNDLNLIIQSVRNLYEVIESAQEQRKAETIDFKSEILRLQDEIERLQTKKERAYEDYSDGIITKDDYLRYKSKYEQQIEVCQSRIETLNQSMEKGTIVTNPWIEKLLQQERLECLDRETIVEMVSMIYIYDDNKIKIVYNFSDELELLLGSYNA